MFTFVMDVIIVVLKSVMIFLHRRWWKIILFGEKTEQYHLQDMKNGFRLTSTLSKLSSDFNQNLKLKKQTFGTRSCFYNYLQLAVPTPTTKAPHDAYVRAQEPFISVINSYEPDVIFAWGKPTYDNTPAYKGVELEPLQFENIIAKRYEYTLDSGKKCVMINVHHPSCRFSYSQWHEIIKQALC